MSRTYRRKDCTEYAEHNKADFLQPSGWMLWQLKIYGNYNCECYSIEECYEARAVLWERNKLYNHNDKWSGRYKWKQGVQKEARKKRRQAELSELTKVILDNEYEPQFTKSKLYSDKWYWD